jgi:hypothetical protein
MMPDVKLPKKFTREGCRIVMVSWSLDGGWNSDVGSEGMLSGVRVSWLECSEAGLWPDGSGWSSIASMVMVEDIFTAFLRFEISEWTYVGLRMDEYISG